MAEVKNAFIKSKMNKDLDSRLLPSGEYRDGQNIQVSKSEGEDVGALENVVGNLPVITSTDANADFRSLSGCGCDLKSIGIHANTNTSTIYIFLTDYTEPPLKPGSYSTTANNYIYSFNTLTLEATKLIEGPFLNFSTTHPIHGINVLENLLFWTDNRNQPRKINLDLVDNGLYYTSEDLISVAKYNPYQTIELYYQAPEVGNQYASSYQDVTSKLLPDGTTANPFYDQNWPGDPDYLEDKFVTFSYRFKFTDGEYSIMAPFTQEAFVPKQDGYFLVDAADPTNINDEKSAYRSTIVQFMENKVNNVKLFVPLPHTANSLNKLLGVESIDILYKESDSLAVKVLDTVLNATFFYNSDGSTENNTFLYEYNYQSRKPYKTLPESEIIRVYDKVPVRALGQEVISNRIVYSNFQDKHTPPETLDYDVAVTKKYDFNINGSKAVQTTSSVEYPSHTVKQNRNYQVGFVLSDRYGRQSTTILSPVSSEKITDQNITFGGSTFFHPYATDPALLDPPESNSINSWPGDSIKVLINQGVPTNKPDLSTGWPGIYQPYLLADGTLNSEYNPLGWYSYKVVVKQTEQEYYNVYLPGILNGYPDHGAGATTEPDPVNTVAFITLLGDNINKVPKDLTEVGPDQKQFRSSVELYGRVTPNSVAPPTINIPYYPVTNPQTVSTIATQDEMFKDDTGGGGNVGPPYATIYQEDSNPYLARLAQGGNSGNPIGSLQQANYQTAYTILLGVFETAPVQSLLDIFWETSSTGLVSDFNAAAGASGNSDGFESFDFIQTEATENGQNATASPFAPRIESTTIDGGVPITNSVVTLLSVVDGSGNPVTGNWNLISLGKTEGLTYDRYNLQVVNSMYFSPTLNLNTFTFNFGVTDEDTSNTFNMSITGVLINVQPNISIDIPSPVLSPERDNDVAIAQLSGTNGTVTPNSTNTPVNANLTYKILNQNPSTPVLELRSNNAIYEASGNASGAYTFTAQVTDSGEATAVIDTRIVFGKEEINADFGSASGISLTTGLESTGVYWASNYQDPSFFDNPPASVTNDSSGREVYSQLELDPNQLVGMSRQTTSELSEYYDRDSNGSQGLPYGWRNTNIKPKFFNDSFSGTDNSLKNGTAFIKVDFNFISWPKIVSSENENNVVNSYWGEPQNGQQYGVGWVAYLQYKSNQPNSQWGQAFDVEDQPIRFGCSQANALNVNRVFELSGALANSNIAQGYNNESAVPLDYQEPAAVEDIVQSTAPYSDSGLGFLNAKSVASKVFVFGKDQGYENSPDRFGEYRLLIKYPQSLRSNRRPQATMTAPLPTAQNWEVQGQAFAFLGSELVDSNINVDLSFGDFYYTGGDLSYSYFISQGANDSGSAATQLLGSNQVFAREWSHKYVTQFFNDAGLTEPWIPGVRSWFSYSGTTVNDYNSQNGAENSFLEGIIPPSSQVISKDTLNNDKNTSNRRWVAEFDANGKKIRGSATPSTGNVSNP